MKRRSGESMDAYRRRRAIDKKQTKEAAKGKLVWLSAALVPMRDLETNSVPSPLDLAKKTIGGTYRKPL